MKETKARRELEDRLSTVLVELEEARDTRQKLADELAVRDSQLEESRRHLASFDRDFRRHVELLRQLKEAREENEEMRRKLDGGSGLLMLSADGRLRRTVVQHLLG